MAWHKVGNSYLNDAELRAESTTFFHFLVDICLPGFITYLGVGALADWLGHYQFFVVHTTTAKLIYVVAGVIIFSIGYELRKIVIVMGFLAFVGAIMFGMSADLFHWLAK